MKPNTVTIGNFWDFTKEDQLVFFQEGGETQTYHITKVRSETVFSFDVECPLCPGFGEGKYGEDFVISKYGKE